LWWSSISMMCLNSSHFNRFCFHFWVCIFLYQVCHMWSSIEIQFGASLGNAQNNEHEKQILYHGSPFQPIWGCLPTLKWEKWRPLGSFFFSCVSIVTLLNDGAQFQTKLVSQGCNLEVWLIYGSNIDDQVYGWLGSPVPVIPTKECISGI